MAGGYRTRRGRKRGSNEPKPANNEQSDMDIANTFKTPSVLDCEGGQNSACSSINDQDIVDSTCSTVPSTSRVMDNPESQAIDSNVPLAEIIADDEEAQFNNAIRISLEEARGKSREEEELEEAIKASISDMHECSASSMVPVKGIMNNGIEISDDVPLVSSTPISRAHNTINSCLTLESDTTNNDSSVFIVDGSPTNSISASAGGDGSMHQPLNIGEKCKKSEKDVLVQAISMQNINCDTSNAKQNWPKKKSHNSKQNVENESHSSFDSEELSDNEISSSTKNGKSRKVKNAPSKFHKQSIGSDSTDESQDYVSCNETPEDTPLNAGDGSSVLIVEENDIDSAEQCKSFTAGEKRLHIQYRIAEQQFRRVLRRRMSQDAIPSVASIEVIKSQHLESAFHRQKEAFEMASVSTNELFVYHMCRISEEDKADVIENNLSVKNSTGYTFGRGIYFSEYPDIDIGYGECGLLLCKVMPGNEYLDKSYRLIPKDYNSKRVLASKGTEEILIIENSSQILPCFIIHLSSSHKSVRPLSLSDDTDPASIREEATSSSRSTYRYKVIVPSDNRRRPLDEDTGPNVTTVYTNSVPKNTRVPEVNDEEGICGSTSTAGQIRVPTTPVSQILSNEQVANKMRNMFEQSLKLQETGELMLAAEGIVTQLYKHQMIALAWMANRENSKDAGVIGGILADDMGLGKTLTMLALVISNFHDKRPLAKPEWGHSRAANRPQSVIRYLPACQTYSRKIPRATNRWQPKSDSQVGSKLNGAANKQNNLSSAFGHLLPKRRKDLKQKIKSSNANRGGNANGYSSLSANSGNAFDALPSPETSEEEGEPDEFDSMCFSSTSTLTERLLGSKDKSTSSLLVKREKHFYDGLSDDEEYQQMTEAERNERLRPKFEAKKDDVDKKQEMDQCLNLDGQPKDLLSSSEDDENLVTTTCAVKKGRKRVLSDDEDDRHKRSRLTEDINVNSSWDDFNELPDVEEGMQSGELTNDSKNNDAGAKIIQTQYMRRPEKAKNRHSVSTLDLTEEQRKNLIVPPRDPPKLNNRRRATLVLTPASVIGQWLSQIEEHVDDKVNLKITVHHGQHKALLGTELQDNDIVISTYGTLQAEYGSYQPGPLLRAKWLRVMLDEGHFIKNHNSQTAKACYELNTRRKWIISGTPIQNNLTELWALLKWLEFEPYASHRSLFKRQIEHAVKHGHPHGIERLQTIMTAICLRRTKSDQINGKPIVDLPTKTVTTTELDFTEEELAIYKIYESQGREMILRYQRQGSLLRNYAHVFAVMMRLRQLCCHRELLPVQWKDVDMNELMEHARRDMAAANAAKALLNGEQTPEDEDRAKNLAEQLRDMIKEGLSDECAICLSEFQQPVITPCAHIYCKACIVLHIETTSSQTSLAQCPLCRGDITKEKLLEAAQCQEDDENIDGKGNWDPFEDIKVDVSSTKLNAVMRQLEISKLKGGEEKIIIVSQFTKLLSIVQPLLDDAGYTWTRLDGSMNIRERARVISNFQDASPDSPRILLLSLRAGGVGLNLTAARKLILLDPAWNPATEEQCFDRIHRLGQTQDCEIIRFVHKNSIEDRMLAIQEKKKNLISGAFRQTVSEMRQQRIQDILSIFGI